MVRIKVVLLSELRKKCWNSPLQLMVAGLLLYYLAMAFAPAYICGPSNSDISKGVFRCLYGEMSVLSKLIIISGIALASLCLGRAVSLAEKRSYKAD